MARPRDPVRTTRDLLDSARVEFVSEGFSGAKTESIVSRAGITRGALYHHFADKRALFEAVVEAIQVEISTEVAAAARGAATPFAALRSGLGAYLDACTRADVRRIVLVDGPSVLGWDRWHEIDMAHGFEAMRLGVRASVASGELVGVSEDPFTRVLLGLVTQVGIEIGRSPDPEVARRDLGAAVDVMLDRVGG